MAALRAGMAASRPSSPANAARLRVQGEFDGYNRRMAEAQYLNQQMDAQNALLVADYQLALQQEAGQKQYALGASGAGDMGRVMAAAKLKFAGVAEMGHVSQAVKAALNP